MNPIGDDAMVVTDCNGGDVGETLLIDKFSGGLGRGELTFPSAILARGDMLEVGLADIVGGAGAAPPSGVRVVLSIGVRVVLSIGVRVGPDSRRGVVISKENPARSRLLLGLVPIIQSEPAIDSFVIRLHGRRECRPSERNESRNLLLVLTNCGNIF
jgi:hypothetical protein